MLSLIRYFLLIGSTQFGGALAIAARIQRDLVDHKKWLTPDEFQEGLAISQSLPGPIVAQLSYYIGWKKHGPLGAFLSGFFFLAPSCFLVSLLAHLYQNGSAVHWVHGALFGVGGLVATLLLRGAVALIKRNVAHDSKMMFLFALNSILQLAIHSPLRWALFPLSAILMIVWKRTGSNRLISISPVLLTVFLTFLKAGGLAFGGGMAIIPYLHDQLVHHLQWLTNEQFIDAFSIAMITPGPVVVIAPFAGYLVGGALGAVLAALGIFIPGFLGVIVLAPFFRKLSHLSDFRAGVQGFICAALGAIISASFLVGRETLDNPASIAIALGSLLVLWRFKKIPEITWFFVTAGIGILLKSWHP